MKTVTVEVPGKVGTWRVKLEMEDDADVPGRLSGLVGWGSEDPQTGERKTYWCPVGWPPGLLAVRNAVAIPAADTPHVVG